jgi:hypothetical protein
MFYTIDGRSLDDLIWQALSWEGGVAPAIPARDTADTAFGPPVLVRRERLVASTLQLTLDVRPDVIGQRPAILDAILRRCRGVREIVRDDAPSRAWYGELVDAKATIPAGNLVNPCTLLDLVFRVPDPRRHDLETQLRTLSATPTAIPTGTGTSAPRIRIFGGGTAVVDPEIVLRAPSGAELARLELTGSLGSNTWLDVDVASEWIHLVSSGTRTSALSWLTSGQFPVLDANDAAGPEGPYPTLALESASGTPTGVVLWRRSWH